MRPSLPPWYQNGTYTSCAQRKTQTNESTKMKISKFSINHKCTKKNLFPKQTVPRQVMLITKYWASLCIFIFGTFIKHILYCSSSPPPIWNHKSNFAAKCEFMAKSGICDNFPQNVNLWQSPEQTIERPICPCRRSIFLLGIFGKFIQTFAYTDTFWNSDFQIWISFFFVMILSFTLLHFPQNQFQRFYNQKYSYLCFKYIRNMYLCLKCWGWGAPGF